MRINLNTVITLENNEKYIVLNETVYDDNKYYLVMGIDDNNQVIQSKVAIIKEIVEDDLYIEKINDSNLISELTKALKEQN